MEVDAKKLAEMQAVTKEAMEFTAEAMPLLQKAAETEAQVAAKIPALVDDLIKRGFIEATIRESAVKNLQDPLRLIDAMGKLAALQTKPATEKSAGALPSMGSPERAKTASANEKPMKESDKVFLERFGLLR